MDRPAGQRLDTKTRQSVMNKQRKQMKSGKNKNTPVNGRRTAVPTTVATWSMLASAPSGTATSTGPSSPKKNGESEQFDLNTWLSDDDAMDMNDHDHGESPSRIRV